MQAYPLTPLAFPLPCPFPRAMPTSSFCCIRTAKASSARSAAAARLSGTCCGYGSAPLPPVAAGPGGATGSVGGREAPSGVAPLGTGKAGPRTSSGWRGTAPVAASPLSGTECGGAAHVAASPLPGGSARVAARPLPPPCTGRAVPSCSAPVAARTSGMSSVAVGRGAIPVSASKAAECGWPPPPGCVAVCRAPPPPPPAKKAAGQVEVGVTPACTVGCAVPDGAGCVACASSTGRGIAARGGKCCCCS